MIAQNEINMQEELAMKLTIVQSHINIVQGGFQ